MQRLKDKILFVQAETVSDLSGGWLNDGNTILYECWANVTQSNSSRQFQEMQIANMVLVTVQMRTNPIFAPQAGHNIIWRDRFLTVHGEPDLSQRQFIEFQAAYDPKVKVSENGTSIY